MSNDSKLVFKSGKEMTKDGVAISFWLKLPNLTGIDYVPIVKFSDDVQVQLK
jgi:hypothetical protein